jgi:hypothetical protein
VGVVSSWDIEPDGVRSVVVKTGGVAQHLEGQARSYASHMQSAAAAAGTLSQGGNAPHGGLVGLSLGQFAEATQGGLRYLAERTTRSLQGTVDATKAYLTGDLQMAADAQHTAELPPGYDPATSRLRGPR